MDWWQNVKNLEDSNPSITKAGTASPAFEGICFDLGQSRFSKASGICPQVGFVGRAEGKRDIGFQKISNQARQLRLAAAQTSTGLDGLLCWRYFFVLRLQKV